ncbi:MAG TPA: metalloregulator ArsR/SmtB family transcription factor [Bacteroidales bacterium]|nr:metalloregulator ArsR/SmtB family transcription factor [Bacteroidales bacterium]
MSNINLDPERLERAAGILKAMAHPVRISILNALEGNKKMTVTEIHKLLGLEQSTASHHLGIMKDKRVLVSRREGKNIYYSIRDESLKNLLYCLNSCEK